MRATTTCITEGCDSPRSARGLCLKHYKQAGKVGNLPPILCGMCGAHIGKGRKLCDTCRSLTRSAHRQQQNVKKAQERQSNARCRLCGEPRPRARQFCKSCAASRTRMLRVASNLAKFGMTEQDYWMTLAQQSYSCAICKLPVWDRAEKKLYAVDHDHECCNGPRSCGKCVRGVLCIRCNLGLGSYLDDPDLLRAAAQYVETHRLDRELRQKHKMTRARSTSGPMADEVAA